jgi:heterodisulfide reductase subunit B
MRAAQLGMEDRIFASRTPWLCASCQTCTTRCPQGIDVARVMDFIVGEALARGIKPVIPNIALFNKVFLRYAGWFGRSYDLGLLAEMNFRTLQPFKDIGLGVDMVKHRKIKVLPAVVRRKRRKTPIEPASRPVNEVGYFPGCSLHSMAAEFDRSTRAVLEALGVNPVEPEGWVCCGSTPAHRVDHHLATRLPLESLILYEQEGLSEVTLPCAACFNRFRAATRDIRLDPALREDIEREIGQPYHDSLQITSLPDLIVQRIGLETVEKKVKRPLEGLKVACYYGCLLTRPPGVTGAARAEYPDTVDRLMRALGATPVDWDRKVACCGASLSATETDIVLELSSEILANAKARGADVVAVACPLCHTNLDGRQTQMKGAPIVPAMYFTQLIAIALGMPGDAALDRNLINPRPVLAGRGLL